MGIGLRHETLDGCTLWGIYICFSILRCVFTDTNTVIACIIIVNIIIIIHLILNTPDSHDSHDSHFRPQPITTKAASPAP